MNRILLLILNIIIYIVKNINKNTGMLIDVLENMYTLTINVRTKTLEKMIKVLVLIIGGKIMEIVVDNKIVTVVEIIKIINNYITLNDVWMIIELWVMWIVYIVKMNTNIIYTMHQTKGCEVVSLLFRYRNKGERNMFFVKFSFLCT